MRAARMTISQLENSKVAGINREAIAALKKPEKKKRESLLPGERCHQAQWMWGQLAAWSLSTGIQVVDEHKFSDGRKFRFDFAVPAHKIGIEYEGLMSEKSGHTTLSGYTKDTDKYNLATAEGWRVIRFTVKNYKTVISELEKLINGKEK